jgi:hypothetical protein
MKINILLILILTTSTFANKNLEFLQNKVNQNDTLAIILLEWVNIEKSRGDTEPTNVKTWEDLGCLATTRIPHFT